MKIRTLADAGWANLPLRPVIAFGLAAHGHAKLARGPDQFAGARALSIDRWRASRSRSVPL